MNDYLLPGYISIVTFKKQELSLVLDRIQECNVNFWTLNFKRDMEKLERPKERVNC